MSSSEGVWPGALRLACSRCGLARVAVVEKRPELDAYKIICTHNIQAGAVPAIERLGIWPAIRNAGAVRAQTDIWTRYGWIRPPRRIGA